MAPDSSRPLPEGREMAARIRDFDWASTDIGPPEAWPAHLRAWVDLILECRFPMMLGWGPEFHLLYNDGYIPILGEKHPVIWQTGAEVFGELWSIAGPILEGVYRTGKAERREDLLLPLRRRGYVEDCWFTLSYSPLRGPDGTVVGLLSTAVETSHEVVHARREALLHRVSRPIPPAHPEEAVALACRELDGSPDIPFHVAGWIDGTGAVRILSTGGATVHWRENPTRSRLIAAGWPLEALDGLTLFEAPAAPGDPAPAPARIPVAMLGGLRLDAEASARAEAAFLFPLRDRGREAGLAREPNSGGTGGSGEGFLILGVSNRLPEHRGYRGFLARVADVVDAHHDRHRLLTLLRAEAENRFHQLFENALDAIVLGRPTGDILAANPAACRLLGYSEAELIAGGRAMVQAPEDARWTQGVEERAESGSFSGELLWVHRSGRRIPCDVTSRIFTDAMGEARTTVIFRDVSERIALQARVEEARRMEILAQVSGGIAHDFNNLLAVVNLQTDLLRDSLADDPEALEDLELLNDTTRRAAGLIRRLLDLTRRSPGVPQPFHPATLLSEMAPLLRRIVGEDGELTFALDEEVPELLMVPQQFEQIVLNLVVNARDAIRDAGRRGTIRIEVDRGDRADELCLRVADDGVGIPESIRSRLFEPFFTTKATGTGIGLNTVRLVAEDLGGRVGVESEPGRGSTFAVCLRGQVGARTAASPKPSSGPMRLDGVRVLLVEDQAHLRQVLAAVLRRQGAEVDVALNGEEALRRVASDGLPDVIVSDVVMPLLSGPEFVARVRERYGPVPVVLMSGYADGEALPGDLADLGTFLAKPFASEELVRAVREVLDA